jgi:hypothetical protein
MFPFKKDVESITISVIFDCYLLMLAYDNHDIT